MDCRGGRCRPKRNIINHVIARNMEKYAPLPYREGVKFPVTLKAPSGELTLGNRHRLFPVWMARVIVKNNPELFDLDRRRWE